MKIVASNHEPSRCCIACRKHAIRKDLCRFVKDSQGHVFLDRRGNASGRGAYVCSPECFKKACKTKCFDRALKIKMSDQDYEALKAQFDAVFHPKHG